MLWKEQPLKMVNQLLWLFMGKTIILLMLTSYIYILTKKLQGRDRYLKGNNGVKQNVEFWKRILTHFCWTRKIRRLKIHF